jgi:hypothetical protein
MTKQKGSDLLRILYPKNCPIDFDVRRSSGNPRVLQWIGRFGCNRQLIRHTLAAQIVDAKTPRHRRQIQNEIVVKFSPGSARRTEQMVDKGNIEPGIVSHE